jgi:serine protease Do
MPIRLVQLFIIIMVFTSVKGWAGDKDSQIYPMPVTEMTHIVAGWLEDSGLKVDQEKTLQGQIRMIGSDSHGSWEINLEPRSALSTAVTVIYRKNGTNPGTTHDLHDYLKQYRTDTPTAPSAQTPEIPREVLERIGATVCMHTANKEEFIEFSGFFVDKEIVLSTAHGLKEHQEITVLTSSGQEYKGEILKFDSGRDLALVKINTGHEQVIALDTGRNLLGKREKVYSIGCPATSQGTIHSGQINGPPRRIGQYPLWQVIMEIHPGRSGSPVFDGQGALVGVIKGRYRGTDSTGFLIPMETIIDFLNDFFAQCNMDAIK